MKVAILYNKPETNLLLENDVLLQLEAVRNAIQELAYEVVEFGCDLNLSALKSFLEKEEPCVVFNLVESLGGSDRLISIVPSFLEVLGIPYTGCSAKHLSVTSDKLVAKKVMLESDISTPLVFINERSDFIPATRYIIKPIYEHASFGLDDSSIVSFAHKNELLDEIAKREQKFNRPFFAEQYIEGREFNVSIISSPIGGPMVLPVAEMDFDHFPEGKPKIYGYDAKWNEESLEYENINRRFKDFSQESALIDKMQELSLKCWHAFNLKGYARVDLRVDLDNNPYVLEINANPCLTPLCGFPTAIDLSGVGYTKAVDWMIQQAIGTFS